MGNLHRTNSVRCGSSYPYFSHTIGKPCRGVWA
nr:MAG TPA: hypothetical protein [Caudoviricetes sp.]